MGYQVLARKWRPGKFAELVGQEHVVKAISNALDNNRLHHAYLFTGTRGVGKTTIARIFSRSLNCETGVSSNPCGKCASCVDIEQGNYVDLLEIDAASRTKVEDTREILDNVQYRPTRGEFKVYLIDEVHMLSRHSFNALLKTLEEPPPHVKFLLATTDPQKLPVTILSRCLQFNLKALTREQITGQLEHILTQEQIHFEKSALFQLAKSAQGSMRDALSLTDQAIAQGDGKVSPDIVADMLGLIDSDKITRMIDALLSRDKVTLMGISDELSLLGADYKVALGDMMSLFHQIALTQFVPEACKLETSQARKIFDWAKTLPPEHVQLLYQIALQGRKELEWAQDAKSGFEMTLIRLLAFSPKLEVKSATDYKDLAARQEVSVPQVVNQAGTGHKEKKTLDSESQSSDVEPETPEPKVVPGVNSEEHKPVTSMAAVEIPGSNTDTQVSQTEIAESAVQSQLDAEVSHIYEQAEALTGSGNIPSVDHEVPQFSSQPDYDAVDEQQQQYPEAGETEHYETTAQQDVPATEPGSYNSTTNDLLALHSQLKYRQATDSAAKEAIASVSSESEEQGIEETAAAIITSTDESDTAHEKQKPLTATPPAVEYQDDLYTRGADFPPGQGTAVLSQSEGVTTDNADLENSSYFSAEGFLQEHQQYTVPAEPAQDLGTFESDSIADAYEYQQSPEFQSEQVRPESVQTEDMPVVEYGVEDAQQEEVFPDPDKAPAEPVPVSLDTGEVPESFDAYALPEWITFEQANTVSVDFEIPFKINGQKVLHARQLDTWSQLIEQSGIGALTKQLVLHSNYVKKGDVVELVIAQQQQHLLNEATIKTIEEALSATLQQKISLQITVGEVIDTPWAVQQAINQMRQEHAEKTIQGDSVVAELCEQFSGTVLKETIKPR